MSVASAVNNGFRMMGYQTVERLSDCPDVWRHCCGNVGVQRFPQPMSTTCDGVTVLYIACPYCSKVIYYFEEFM